MSERRWNALSDDSIRRPADPASRFHRFPSSAGRESRRFPNRVAEGSGGRSSARSVRSPLRGEEGVLGAGIEGLGLYAWRDGTASAPRGHGGSWDTWVDGGQALGGFHSFPTSPSLLGMCCIAAATMVVRAKGWPRRSGGWEVCVCSKGRRRSERDRVWSGGREGRAWSETVRSGVQ